MTKTEYMNKVYVGKHAPKPYQVWRVHGPGGPQETVVVTGKRSALNACIGMWDFEIRDYEGRVIPYKTIRIWEKIT